MIGRIHSIVTTGTVDGPGIRLVLFMQGCQFKCLYCHNPDSWDIKGGKEMTSDEVAKEILKYKWFINKGKGGLTVSGGEPLMQIDFLIELFTIIKKEDIHIALDTNGFHITDSEKLNKLMSLVDLVLLDIKHIDFEKHKLLTGQEASLSHNMATYLAKINKPTWIRYVVVPDWTTQIEYAQALARFIKPMKNIELVELLPFHQMGKQKWKEVGKDYELEGLAPLERSELADIKDVFEKTGIKTK